MAYRSADRQGQSAPKKAPEIYLIAGAWSFTSAVRSQLAHSKDARSVLPALHTTSAALTSADVFVSAARGAWTYWFLLRVWMS